MVYKATPFVVLTIGSYGFDVGNEKLQFYKRWKDTDYRLGHIEPADIARFVVGIYLSWDGLDIVLEQKRFELKKELIQDWVLLVILCFYDIRKNTCDGNWV